MVWPFFGSGAKKGVEPFCDNRIIWCLVDFFYVFVLVCLCLFLGQRYLRQHMAMDLFCLFSFNRGFLYNESHFGYLMRVSFCLLLFLHAHTFTPTFSISAVDALQLVSICHCNYLKLRQIQSCIITKLLTYSQKQKKILFLSYTFFKVLYFSISLLQ